MPVLQLDHFRLHYRDLGQGEPLLLIHGLGSSGADWAFQIESLSRHFRLIIPDLRGSGLSDAPGGPYSIAQFALDLWALLDQLGIDRIQVMGFSLGGAVATEMALQRPDVIARLMTINSLPSYRLDSWRKRMELISQIILVRGVGMRRLARIAAKRMFREPHQEPMRRRVVEVVGATSRKPYLQSVRALAQWCALDRMSAIRSEWLMLAGEHDYTPLPEKRAYAERFGARFAVISGSRHGTPFDAIEACNKVALAFFLGQPLPDAESLIIDGPERAPRAAPPCF
ncbi:MAG TPA: alpha/beta hydrolase [Dokdonella sp.]|uniref:alpha/beta fold hydrolase n=1 Tax=Dokdonella sp. TaxID=2291710 RepID=UPI002D7F2F36|nr:alpha/beta hydrolase [Dokdonella sp.]HET9033169.1 alpha/beta hydrolase [Dokdonella sp.]